MKKIVLLSIFSLSMLMAQERPPLLKAQEEALKIYEQNSSNDHYAENLIRRAIVKEFAYRKPPTMSQKQYVEFLSEYGHMLSEGGVEERTNGGAIVPCDAEMILERARELDPQRALTHLYLANLNLKLYLSDADSKLYTSEYFSQPRDILEMNIAESSCASAKAVKSLGYEAKKSFLEYQRLAKDFNSSNETVQKLQKIFSQQGSFMIIKPRVFSFDGDKEFCTYYVQMLNRLPQSKRASQCKHKLSNISEEFEQITYDELNDFTKKNLDPTLKDTSCRLVRYKYKTGVSQGKWEDYIDDGEERLLQYGSRVSCRYKLLDFTYKTQGGK